MFNCNVLGEAPAPDASAPDASAPDASAPDASALELPLERVEATLTEGAAHLAAATCRWLGHLAEFDRRGGWASWGCRSAAHWLTFRCGVDLHAAREQVKVASRLEDLPHIRHAFSNGELSWWQVRQLCRVATPETDESLLCLARAATTPQLASIVGGLKRVLALEQDLHPRRCLRSFIDEDGFLVISGRLAPDEGMVVARALDAIVDDLLRAKRCRIRPAAAPVADHPHDPPGDADDPPAATRADALVRMARLALIQSSSETQDRAQVVVHVDREVLARAAAARTSATEPAPAPDPAHAPTPGAIHTAHPEGAARPPSTHTSHPGRAARGPATHGAGHVPERAAPRRTPDDPAHDPDLLSDPTQDASPPAGPCPPHVPGRCELEGGPSIPESTALRLACDAALVTLVEDQDGTPLNVGRKTRSIPPALRRALRARDGGCRFPGCPEQRFVEGHHLRHWAHGGETSLANLTEMCRFHHRLVHEGGWRIEGTPPHLRFLRPDGTPIERHPPHEPADGDLEQANRAHGLRIDPDTIVSGWRGERLRLGYVVSCVVESREWQASVAARAAAEPRAGPGGQES